MAKAIRVRLAPQVENRGGGFVDPESGKVLSKLKYDKDGSIEVPQTKFLLARIEAGELVRVEVKRNDGGEGKPPGDADKGGQGASQKPAKKGKAK